MSNPPSQSPQGQRVSGNTHTHILYSLRATLVTAAGGGVSGETKMANNSAFLKTVCVNSSADRERPLGPTHNSAGENVYMLILHPSRPRPSFTYLPRKPAPTRRTPQTIKRCFLFTETSSLRLDTSQNTGSDSGGIRCRLHAVSQLTGGFHRRDRTRTRCRERQQTNTKRLRASSAREGGVTLR